MNHIFGFFLTKWMDKCMGDNSGNGECIVFTLEPNTRCFQWKESVSEDSIGENLFYLADWNMLVVGGNGDPKNSAVTIEKNFSKCTFGCSKTFGMVQIGQKNFELDFRSNFSNFFFPNNEVLNTVFDLFVAGKNILDESVKNNTIGDIWSCSDVEVWQIQAEN